MRRTIMAMMVLIAACGITPKQASDATTGACKIVDAFAGDAIVDSICATAPELAALATIVAESRKADPASAHKVSACRPIPDTATCATDAELRMAIQKVKASR